MTSTTRKKAVVIGAGLGGLATAVRLGAQGWEIVVCERSGSPGGKMNRVEAQGFRFDTGPSLITMPWVFEELFQAAGKRLDEHIEFMPVEPLAEYFFADGTHLTHTSVLHEWLNTVRGLEGGSAVGFLEFMRLGARLFEVSKATFFKQAPFERPDASALKILPQIPLRHGFGHYHRVVSHYFRSPHLIQLFDRYTTYVGSSPWQTPSTLSVIPFVEYAFGGRHIRGGLYRLIEVLVELIRQYEGEIRLNAPVHHIRCVNGRVEGVELESGAFLPAEVVIMNGDASTLPRLLGQSPAPLPECDRSLSGLIFLFATGTTRPGEPHHRVYFSADYAREFDELFRQRRFPDDPTVYINMPSRTDRSLTPGEGEVVFVMANAPANDGDDWSEDQLATARRRVFQRLEKSGFHLPESDIVFSSAWTPRRMADTYDMPGGAIYGTHSHGWRKAFMRPPNRVRGVHGLYAVGGSTHPGGGTPTVLMSADIVCRMIRRDTTSA